MFSASKTSGPSGYNLTNSLRFRASASARLSKTFGSATNYKIQTFSAWVKRGLLSSSTTYRLMGGYNGSAANSTEINFNNDTLRVEFGGAANNALITTQVFRDPSAWYHIVVTIDTPQATASNRVKVYVNGTQVTAFGTANYPAQNADSQLTSANANNSIGAGWSGFEYFDGYMDEINFIDGQALTPSSFGSTNATTGVWQPARYTGTYGTNGFYLNFTDIALTSGSNTGLGRDFSGNGNFWNTNNISVTAGVTYDAMTDVPTNTSATVANYAVMNPLALGTSQTSLIQGNLYAIPTAGASNWGTAFSTIAIPTSGKYYIEATAVVYTGVGNNSSLGVVDSATFIPTNTTILYQYTTGEGFDGILCHLFSDYVSPISDGVQGTNVTGITGTSVNLMLALDVDNGKVYAGYNGTWLNSGNPAGNTGEVATRTFSSTDVVAGQTSYNGSNDQAQYFNFGQRPFAYTPPTGFVALNTFNLPTPTILQGNRFMDATLYTGNGSSQTIVNQGQFRPDLVWVKVRSSTYSHYIGDSVRGINNMIFSNAANAETTVAGSITAFNNNGFSVGSEISTNNNTSTFVGWQWQAGQGSTSSNTSGSITSTVSVNTTAGFSIATYTGNGSTGATFGHGLGVAPKMVIIKKRSTTGNWITYHTSTGINQYLYLNSTAASATATPTWGVSSTLITLQQSFSDYNTSATTYVAYCWAEIPGFSAFGSYTGNGSDDGSFVYTGFRPKYILIKRTDTTNNWYIKDTSRNPFNAAGNTLLADVSDAEYGPSNTLIDILSNGFKSRTTSAGANASGGTYIYAAFAENPFKNALAR